MKALTVVFRGLRFPRLLRGAKAVGGSFPAQRYPKRSPAVFPAHLRQDPGVGREECALPGWGSGGLVGSMG